jgi:hypothetical protein
MADYVSKFVRLARLHSANELRDPILSVESYNEWRSGASVNLKVQKWYKPKLNKYGEPKLYLNELDIIELQFALDMFRDIYINNIHNMKYKEKMREAHWYADYALLICKNAAKSETERRYNEWRTNEIQRSGQDSGKKPHDREQRGWYK